jgi:hypothetical protein
MEMITETLSGELSIDNPNERKAFLIDRINDVIKPPRPATEDNVNIRAMYLLNDLVNSHGGRFEGEELSVLSKLILDTPVMIRHNRAEAPLARTFHAELEEKEDVLWLKSYFYWPSRGEGAADEVLEKIDSGILKECSISFVYTLPQCSVCGEDMRKCPHDINLSSNDNLRQYFYYRGIKEVLETSLVYKGSVKGTFVTDRLARSGVIQVTALFGNHKRLITIPKPEDRRAILLHLDIDNKSLPELSVDDPAIKSTIARKNGHLYLAVASR